MLGLARKAMSNNVLHVDTKPVCSPALELCRVFSGSPYGLSRCWPETNRLTVISVAKISLFRVSKSCNLQSLIVATHMQSFSETREIFFYIGKKGFPSGSNGKESACNAGDPGSIPGLGVLLEMGMATHSRILAWRIPWTEEPGRLQSIGSQRVRHNWTTEHAHVIEMNSMEYSTPCYSQWTGKW